MSDYFQRVPASSSPLWRGKEPLLPWLDMELTERCNNDCIHCCVNLPAGDGAARARELSTEEIKAILREAASLGCLTVRFTGGEPLLRKDFEDLYLFTRQLGIKVLLFTNARLVTPRLSALFIRIPPGMEIEVTVYGMRAESYEAVSRVPGSFAQFRRGIELLLERRVPFIVKGALLPPNQDELAEFKRWAGTIPWMVGPPQYAMCFDLRNRRDSPERNRLIKSLRATTEQGLSVLKRTGARYREETLNFCGKFTGVPGDRLFDCGAGRGGCVDPYGGFRPCMTFCAPEWTYDLRCGTLRDALENFFPRLRDLRATSAAYLERCARCFLKGLCEQCPAKSWAETGSLDTPLEYFCQFAHQQARDLGLIGLDEEAWKVLDSRRRLERLAEAPNSESRCKTRHCGGGVQQLVQTEAHEPGT
jgi:radical SAM protein with 4Fe4S-binding SPASM domain